MIRVLTALAVAGLILAVAVFLAGCRGSNPCFGHGFVIKYSGQSARCSDGSWQPAD